MFRGLRFWIALAVAAVLFLIGLFFVEIASR